MWVKRWVNMWLSALEAIWLLRPLYEDLQKRLRVDLGLWYCLHDSQGQYQESYSNKPPTQEGASIDLEEWGQEMELDYRFCIPAFDFKELPTLR